MKKIKLFLSALLMMAMISALTTSVCALEQGAYGVYAGSNYWNPDTGEIDDGGTANAALGDGMSRSVTGTSALVEREGDSYYVTIRLLLQSSTYDAQFWTRTDYNTYASVSYDMMAENAVTDSVDYRFAVTDPFQPIKASMYVVPMGRDTVWYIQLDESTVSSDTGDFIVTVQPIATQDVPASQESQESQEIEETEIASDEEERVDAQMEETTEEAEIPQEDALHTEEMLDEEQEMEPQEDSTEILPTDSEEVTEETNSDENETQGTDMNLGVAMGAVAAMALVAAGAAMALGRKRAKR